MAEKTLIEWAQGSDGETGATWQIVTGCSVVSPGCTNCYAMRLAGTRLRNHPSRKDLTTQTKAGPVWNGKVRFNVGWLRQPLGWKKPRGIFVAAHGDLFHDVVQDWMLVDAFAVMAITQRHRYYVLTKRAERMAKFMKWLATPDGRVALEAAARRLGHTFEHEGQSFLALPLPNVWLGVSAEDQRRAEERIPHLLDTPAAIRWVSAEPLLGAIDWRRWLPTGRQARRPNGEEFLAPHFYMTRCEHCGWCGSSELCLEYRNHDDADVGCPSCLKSMRADELPHVDWIVSGGESGPGARPAHPDWFRSLRDQCAASGAAYFHKQNGAWLGWSQFTAAGIDDDPEQTRFPTMEWEDGKWSDVGHPMWSDTKDGAIDDEHCVGRVGKKLAGAMLDGREHREMPR